MFILIGTLSLVIMIAIGVIRTGKRLKKEEYGEFSAIKWTLAGWASLIICSLIEVSNDGEGNKTVLCIVAIAFIVATLISVIIEKILIGKNLRNEKIKEYNESKDKWES